MNDKKIIENLSDLKELKPSSEFLLKNREILQNQITSFNSEEKVENGILGNFSKVYSIYFKLIPQSVLIAVFTVFMVAGGGYFSLQAAQDTLPGDSLYAAKIIGEKTQLVLTFDDRNKARLGLEFAGKRVQEINRVMSDENRNEKQNEQVEKLVVDFKKEISETRARLEKINQEKNKDNVNIAKETPTKKETNEEAEEVNASDNKDAENSSETTEEIPHVFGANLGKDDQGLKIYDAEAEAETETGTETETEAEAEEGPAPAEQASTTPAEIKEAKSNPEEMIDEAKNLLQNDDIDATLNLINEADEAIEQVGGEVKGEVEEIGDEGAVDIESKKATSTD